MAASPASPTATAAAPGRRSAPPAAGAGALLVVGFVLMSLNTRVAFGQIGPLAPVAGFSPATVSLLGLLPPLCMGAFAPLAAVVRRRLGEERGLWWASLVLVAGAVLRMLSMPGLFAGTVVVSAATAVVNVLIPVLVRKRFPRERVGAMMGLYALSMGAGSALVAAMVVPVAQAAGSWQPAIGLAIVPAVLAAAGLTPQLRHRPARPAPVAAGTERAGRPHVARTGLAWSLTAFFGVQTLAFYTTLAWLPSILVQAGLDRGAAGTGQALLICGVAAGGFAAPILAAKRTDQRPHILATIPGLRRRLHRAPARPDRHRDALGHRPRHRTRRRTSPARRALRPPGERPRPRDRPVHHGPDRRLPPRRHRPRPRLSPAQRDRRLDGSAGRPDRDATHLHRNQHAGRPRPQ
ncbi:MFS transporter [Streptomyces sp. Mg1]|uniref:MFS transporter n=1 Tax=Streptomyces sp. Mg1 TaxID=465541 RepID=UPI00017EA32E|nr:MFS transporter [Streptomyces sp. Mg1]EDX21435.1 QbsM [Streptomyces sp. Mg1]